MKTIEYQIKSETRYTISRSERTDIRRAVVTGGDAFGGFDNEEKARGVALALAEQEVRMAQPADLVIRHDGVSWDWETERWSDEPTSAE